MTEMNALPEDPIVEEVRKAGREYFAQFNGDLDAAFEDLRRRTESARQAGSDVVNLPPRRPQSWREQSKKAG